MVQWVGEEFRGLHAADDPLGRSGSGSSGPALVRLEHSSWREWPIWTIRPSLTGASQLLYPCIHFHRGESMITRRQALLALAVTALAACGDSEPAPSAYSAAVKLSSDWKSVAAGTFHTAAVKTDGTLWAWGNNDNGEVGNGTTTNQSSPVQIGSGFASVAAGGAHTVAVKTDGTLWAWGANGNGQLGDGTNTEQWSPVQIGSGFASVAAGSLHTMAVKTDGTLWAWGWNGGGQLGDGTTTHTDQWSPEQIGSGF